MLTEPSSSMQGHSKSEVLAACLYAARRGIYYLDAQNSFKHCLRGALL